MNPTNTIEEKVNQIICGDCLDVMKDIPDKSIDLVLTDPPYGMEFKSNYRKIKYEKIQNDNNLNWLEDFLKESNRVLKDDTHIYIFCSFHNIDIFKQEISKLFEVKNILVWIKNNTGMGDLEGDYAPQYEFCIYARKGNKKLNNGRDSNILYFDRTGNINHPTEKPVSLMGFLINKSSNEGDTVLDCFLGSGTTAVACKQLNRNFIGIELSEKYCEIARERLRQGILI